MRTIWLVFFLGLIMSGCASDFDGKPLPRITFDHVQPLYVSYQLVSIENRYDPSLYPEDRSVHFFMPPAQAVEDFLRARIQPDTVQSTGIFRAVIDEAIVTYDTLPSESQFGEWFDVAGRERYKIDIKIRLLPDVNTLTVREGRIVNFSRHITFSEHVSIAEREAIQLKLLEAMIRDINIGVTNIMTHKMGIVLEDLLPPEMGEEHHQEGEKLKPAEDHAHTQNPFGAVGQGLEIPERPNGFPQSGSNIGN